jgi:hypothetical protein
VGGTAMAKIIDFIFPIAPLPKDNKQRDEVINGYQIFIRKDTKDYVKGFLFELLLLGVGAYSISHGYSTINIITLVCILLPTMVYMFSLVLFICCRFIRSKDVEYVKLTISLLCSFIFCLSFINIFLGFLNYDSWKNNKYIELDLHTYLFVFGISVFAYFVGYQIFYKNFTNQMAKQEHNHAKIIGFCILGGTVSYPLVRNITNDIFLLIFFPCVLFIVFVSTWSLVNYRQYDNIQRAKKGMTFK